MQYDPPAEYDISVLVHPLKLVNILYHFGAHLQILCFVEMRVQDYKLQVVELVYVPFFKTSLKNQLYYIMTFENSQSSGTFSYGKGIEFFSDGDVLLDMENSDHTILQVFDDGFYNIPLLYLSQISSTYQAKPWKARRLP
jgi:hypothetical protein